MGLPLNMGKGMRPKTGVGGTERETRKGTKVQLALQTRTHNNTKYYIKG